MQLFRVFQEESLIKLEDRTCVDSEEKFIMLTLQVRKRLHFVPNSERDSMHYINLISIHFISCRELMQPAGSEFY